MFHPFGEFDEWYLKEYECQEEGSDYSKDDCQQKLMQKCAEEEGDELCDWFGGFPADDEFEIEVSIEKEMHWFVPFAIELFEVVGVPPVFVELPVV